MTEVEFSRLLSDLSETAKKLNKESDSLNGTITGCEAMLAKLNIGLEVWLTSHALDSAAWVEENEQTEEEVDRGTADHELGWAEVHDGWHLVVRGVRYQRNVYGNLVFYQEDHRRALLDCSRRDRIEGLRQLPKLVEALNAEADAALKAIEGAKKLVK